MATFAPKKKVGSNRICCLFSCNSTAKRNRECSFHRFPISDQFVVKDNVFGVQESVNRRKEWLRLLQIDEVSDSMTVCSKHFLRSDYFFPDMNVHQRILKKTAVPSQNLPQTNYLPIRVKGTLRTLKRKFHMENRLQVETPNMMYEDHSSAASSVKIEVEEHPITIKSEKDDEPTFERHFVYVKEEHDLDTFAHFEDPLLNIQQEQDISTSDDTEMPIEQEIDDNSDLEETYSFDQYVTSGSHCVVEQDTRDIVDNDKTTSDSNELLRDSEPCLQCRYCDEIFTATKIFIQHLRTCVKKLEAIRSDDEVEHSSDIMTIEDNQTTLTKYCIKQEQNVFSYSEDIDIMIKQEIDDTSHLEETDSFGQEYVASESDCVVKQETNDKDIVVDDSETMNSDTSELLNNPYFVCRYCDEPFEATSIFIQHVETCVKNPGANRSDAQAERSSIVMTIDNHQSSLTKYRKKNNKIAYQCNHCRKYFSIEKHMAQHIEQRLSAICRCKICDLPFCSVYNLRVHERLKHRPWCEECNTTFASVALFNKHKFCNLSNGTFKCKLCARTYRKLAYVKRHVIKLCHGRDGKAKT